MGGCVTPSQPKYSTLKQVQIKQGSVVNPMTNSALRYVNNPAGSLVAPVPIIDQNTSQVRGLGIQRPYSPGSSIYRPNTPPLGIDGRPSVQSVLPIGSIGSMNSGIPALQRTNTLEASPMLVTTPSITSKPIQITHQNIINRTQFSNVPSAQPFSLNPTSVPMMNPNQAAVQIIERTSSNIPLPGPSQPYDMNRMNPQPQQIRTQNTTFRQDSRPVSPAPGLAHPPMMSTFVNKTVEEVNISPNYPNHQSNAPVYNQRNVPVYNSGNIPPSVVHHQNMSLPSNIPPNIQSTIPSNAQSSNIPSNIPSNVRSSGFNSNSNIQPNIRVNMPPHPPSNVNPNTSQYSQSPPLQVNPSYNSDQIKETVLPIHSTQAPRIVSPQPPPVRPVTPLQPAINFDRRLLNFDRAMFSTDTKTPQLSSFTYNLDLPISGQNKVRLL